MSLRKIILPSRGGALVWVLLLAALAAWLAIRASGEPVINANLMAMLPSVDRDPVAEDAADKFRQRFERRVVVLVGAADSSEAKAAADAVHETLRGTDMFVELDVRYDENLIRHAGEFYFPLRFGLLSEASRQQLLAGDVAAFERAVLARYFTPVSGLQSDLIERDPFHLLPGFLEERAAGGSARFELEDGYLLTETDGQVFALLSGVLSDSPFSFDLQDRLMPVMQSLGTGMPGVTVLKAGVFFHAAAGSASAKSEISTVGIGALVGIVVLFIAVFRSWRPLGLSLFSIAVGCLGGFATCLALFGQVHLLTLVFGASLIGISVDYSLHYFCDHLRQKENWLPRAALGHVLPGISLGLLTSVIGFVGLLFASFPGMQQMAIFSGAGLIFSYLCVLTIYPLFTRSIRTSHMRQPLIWSAAYARFCQRQWGPKAWLLLAALVALGAGGISQLQHQDDIRQLQAADKMVVAEELRVRSLVGDNLASQFFLVAGIDEAELLAREEQLVRALRAAQQQGHVSGFVALSEFVPSPDRMAENRRLLAPLIAGEESLLQRVAECIGLPSHAVAAYADAFDRAGPVDAKALIDWLESPMARPYRQLWLGASNGRYISAVGLRGVHQPSELSNLADPQSGVTFIDNVGELSALFGDIRRQAGWLILASYVVVSLLLLVRYGLRGGLAVMIAPIVAATTSLGVQGLIGEPLSLFNVLAVLLVLGFGVDYSIFFRETGTDNPSTLVAIALSTITTLLAFGLLALSSTTAVHAFGLTILLGIGVAFLLSPLAGAGKTSGSASA